jgi:hypothetical protein
MAAILGSREDMRRMLGDRPLDRAHTVDRACGPGWDKNASLVLA